MQASLRASLSLIWVLQWPAIVTVKTQGIKVPLSFKPLSCPSCCKPVNRKNLSKADYKTLLSRNIFACPHCQVKIQLPQRWEQMISLGLLTAVIFAPLSYYWRYLEQGALLILAGGVTMVAIGAFNQRLVNDEASTEEGTNE